MADSDGVVAEISQADSEVELRRQLFQICGRWQISGVRNRSFPGVQIYKCGRKIRRMFASNWEVTCATPRWISGAFASSCCWTVLVRVPFWRQRHFCLSPFFVYRCPSSPFFCFCILFLRSPVHFVFFILFLVFVFSACRIFAWRTCPHWSTTLEKPSST